MTNSKTLSWLLIILSFVGFLDATYLTINHYTGGIVPCTTEGCEIVLSSEYATTVGGLPVALFGVVYYIVVFLFALNYLNSRNRNLLTKISFLTGAGVLASLYFLYLQIYVIEAICLYCLGSATITTIIFITSTLHLRKANLAT